MTTDMVAAGASALPNFQLVVGGAPSLNAMLDVANQAQTRLDVDLFVGKGPWFEAITERGKGVDSALYLADPETKKSIRKMVRRAGGQYVTVGDAPAKNHAKSVVADARDGIVSTAAFAPATPYRYEVSARFQGAPAEALAELTASRASGDADRIVAAAAEARRQGIVVNDPEYGVWHLTDEVNNLVRGARHRLIIASKRVEEPGILADIAAARADGVPVAMSKYQKHYPLHANIVIADDRAYIGSGHLTKRVLTGGGSNGRISRELGVVIDDKATVDWLAQSLDANRFVKVDAAGIPRGMSPLAKVGIGIGVLGALGGAALLVHQLNDHS